MKKLEILNVEGKNDRVTITSDRITLKVSEKGYVKEWKIEQINCFMNKLLNNFPDKVEKSLRGGFIFRNNNFILLLGVSSHEKKKYILSIEYILDEENMIIKNIV